VVGEDNGVLFLTNLGEAFTPSRLTQLVRNYVIAADIGKTGACHLFRHTMATLMLENGADIRFIQEMLGHVKIDTTQIYTQVSIRKLKQIHTATHPAKLKRQERAVVDVDVEQADELPVTDLLDTLAQECDDDPE